MQDLSHQGQRFVVKPGVRTFAGNYHGQHGTIIAEYPSGLGDQSMTLVSCHIDGCDDAVLFMTDIEMLVEQP